jgi:hypothetical protein
MTPEQAGKLVDRLVERFPEHGRDEPRFLLRRLEGFPYVNGVRSVERLLAGDHFPTVPELNVAVGDRAQSHPSAKTPPSRPSAPPLPREQSAQRAREVRAQLHPRP